METRTSLLLFFGLMLSCVTAGAQSPFGTSDTTPAQQCGPYQWPEVLAPCPEVQIKQKHDHTPMIQYRRQGWDTVVTCVNTQLELSCMPYTPVQYFNGGYYVDEIPFNPPDTTFYLGYNAAVDANNPNKVKMPISTDDDFSNYSTNIPYPFYFFGIRKNSFVLGANGLVAFGPVPVTNTTATGPDCPWSYSAGIPWTDGTTGAPSNLNYMRDAIYGVYEDTYPSPSVHGSTGDPHWGIYYGVLDSFPCRKIICSWNDVPQYSCTSLRCTYQIVCYEGSNIIEVHVKQRQVCPGWNNGNGIIGIQNATGLPQVKGALGTPNRQVITGSPAAFFPPGKNTFTSNMTNKAYRFTPRGNTVVSDDWFRILDNGDTVHLTIDPTDTNGYFYPRGHMSTCPNLTRAFVSPDRVSRYVYHMKFKNANDDWYDLYDTITIGVDTAKDMSLTAADGSHRYNVCEGSSGTFTLQYPTTQSHDTISWRVTRVSGGQNYELTPNQVLNFGEWSSSTLMNSQQLTLRTALPTDGVRPNKIDSIYIQASISFVSGCTNYDSILVCLYPNFDITDTMGICQGNSYTWTANGQTYTNSVYATANLQSTPGCDSTMHLDLTVFNTSYTIDHVTDCKPYTWPANGQTYYTSNNATAAGDTIRLQNEWGCDSIVQLELSILPVQARIQSNRSFFDFDNLDVELTDVSLNNDSRLWLLPGVANMSGTIAYYTLPADRDEADIWLIATSSYGCSDSTHIVIPMRKESFWIPNVFTPDNASGNNIFSSISTRTVTEEMYIYNRNGKLVFKCEGPDCPWDGKDLNGTPCPQGTYTYIIRYTNEFTPRRVMTRKGTVTLIR